MRQYDALTNEHTTHEQAKLPVSAAAAYLGISAEAVRARIHRGTLHHIKENGKVLVLVERHDVRNNGVSTTDNTDLVVELRDQIKFLKDQLEIRDLELRRREVEHREDSRRKDHIIAALTERLPQIEAPSRSEEHSEEPSLPYDRSSSAVHQNSAKTQRPWWQRVFGW